MYRFARVLLFCPVSLCLAAQWSQPVHFEPVGADATRFVARGLRYGFLISAGEASVNADGKTVRLRFEGSKGARIEGQDRLRATTNILRGNDRAQWRCGIPNYGRLVTHDVYPGIDVVYYSAGGELEYDLVLKPGADPRQIRLRVSGARARLDEDGNLVAGLVHKRPTTWQVAADGTRVAVASRFRKHSGGSFGFELAKYDRSRELVIDPQLTLSIYVSGSNQDIASAIGHDKYGFIYIGGTTYSTDLPVPGTAFQTANAGAAVSPVTSDCFVAKIDPNAAPGAQVVYTTYVGGSLNDQLNAMAVDASGTVYLTGWTKSIDFPLGNAAQSALNGTSDAFVIWLDPSQANASAIYYGTYLGGAKDDSGNGIAVDARGRILVTGQTNSPDFPTANGWLGSLISGTNAFVVVIDTAQSGAGTLYYSTYMGGTNWDAGRSIAAGPDGTVWVTGATYSGDYPLAGAAYQSGYGTGGDAFVTQINPDVAGGSSLLYSTYLGGTGTDEANKVFVDASGQVFVTGFTLSTDFPVTAGSAQKQLGGGSVNAGAANAFVAVLKPSTSVNLASQLVYSTYLGGTGGDEGYDVTEDPAGNIYVAGLTKSSDFPVTAGALQTALLGGPAGFVVKLNPSKTAADFSSYVASGGNQTAYGVYVDARGIIYLTGFTSGAMFDALGGAAKPSATGNTDAFLMGIRP
jgi:Beta-propeller repeat